MLEKQSDITTVCPWCDVVYFKDEVHICFDKQESNMDLITGEECD